MNEHGYTYDQLNDWNKAKAEKRREAAEAAKIDFEALSFDKAVQQALSMHLDGLKLVDLKQILEDYTLVLPKKRKKADIIEGIKKQKPGRISGLIRKIVNKKMKVADLKMYLQREGESVKGTKEELVKRLLESKDILHKGAQSSQPEPALSAKEMGPDVDLLSGEYDYPFPLKQVNKLEDIEGIVAGGLQMKSLRFGNDVSVKGVDLERILSKFGLELLSLSMGDQETGSSVDNHCAEVIARHCPRLQSLHMESCNWSDRLAILVGHSCPRLRYLKISGHDKSCGHLRSAFIRTLVEERSFLKKLKSLNVVDNNVDYDKMRELHKKRRTLKIVSGESDSGKWWGSRGHIFEQVGGRMNWY